MRRVKGKKKNPTSSALCDSGNSMLYISGQAEEWEREMSLEDQTRLVDAETSQLSLPRQHLKPENDEARAKAVRGKGIREEKT